MGGKARRKEEEENKREMSVFSKLLNIRFLHHLLSSSTILLSLVSTVLLITVILSSFCTELALSTSNKLLSRASIFFSFSFNVCWSLLHLLFESSSLQEEPRNTFGLRLFNTTCLVILLCRYLTHNTRVIPAFCVNTSRTTHVSYLLSV